MYFGLTAVILLLIGFVLEANHDEQWPVIEKMTYAELRERHSEAVRKQAEEDEAARAAEAAPVE